jgi:hypothetical protein
MNTEQGTILLVEDDIKLREITAVLLRSYGYDVIETSDAQNVRKIIQSHHKDIQILITDLVMPGKLGFDVALEATSILPHIQIIVMSGLGPDIIPDNIKKMNCTFLSKPVTAQELISAVRLEMRKRYDNRIAS